MANGLREAIPRTNRWPARRTERRAGSTSVREVPGDDGVAADRGDPDTHPRGPRIEDVADVVPVPRIRLGHERGVAPVERCLLAQVHVVTLVLARVAEAHARRAQPALSRAPVLPVV